MGITNKHFIDWFDENIGFGYGTGEHYTTKALKGFLDKCNKSENGAYDYEVIEKAIGKGETWFLMAIFGKADIIEYGTSPRYGWLTERGLLLKEFVKDKTDEELYEIVMVDPAEYVHCYPDACNCDGYVEGKKCDNPLF